jgi:hypothetical protein
LSLPVFTVLPAVRRRSSSSAELSPGHRPANAHRSAVPSVLKQVVNGEQPPEKVLQGIEALSNATP